jgi:hypothetical protein
MSRLQVTALRDLLWRRRPGGKEYRELVRKPSVPNSCDSYLKEGERPQLGYSHAKEKCC